MDDLVDEAVDRGDQERSEGTRETAVVALRRLGGGHLFCPLDSAVLRDAERGRFGTVNGEWIGTDTLVDVQEVR